MNFPFYSVVIPAYNAGKFIGNALDSVRSQVFQNYEIIIVNDGSQDDTLERVKNYFIGYPYLSQKIINQNNKGIGGARNSGINAAVGEFVAFLDADDWWRKDKLLKVKRCLDQKGSIDLICHNEEFVEKGEVSKRLKYGPYKTYKELLFKGNCLSTSATVVRREKLFEAGLFSENLDFNGVEDYELWLRLAKICEIEYLNEMLGVYNFSEGSITRNIAEHMRHSFNVIDYHYSQWPDKKFFYQGQINRRKAELMRATALVFLKTNHKISAGRLLSDSFRLNPFSIKTWISAAAVLIKRGRKSG